MKAGVIKAYMLKELKDLIRSRMIFLVYILPTMIMILFGYGIRMEVTHARTLVIDYDNSRFSIELANKFTHSKYFDTTIANIPENEALRKIKQGDLDILIIIPSSFERNLLAHRKSEIGIFIDGAYPLRALTMQGYVEGVIKQAATALHHHIPFALTINQRLLFNQSLRDENAIVPGLIGLILLVAPALLAALLIVKEKELGTIFNFYSSPIGKIDFLIAKLLPVFLLHSLNIFILFLWAIYLFDVPFRGSFLAYWLVSEIYVLISLGIGLLISIVTRRQIEAVILTVIVTIIPGFLYSGMLMPISSMSGESAIEAHIFPVMYYTHILYDLFLIGDPLIDSSKSMLYLFILLCYAVALMGLGATLLKKELK
jgi:ABC-type multidrug transport system permease subunit